MRGELAVRHGPELQKRAVMFDRRRPVADLVGDDRQVVVGARVARIDLDGAPQQIARVGQTAGRLLHERQIDHRLDVTRVGDERDTEFSRRLIHLSATHESDAKIVVRPDVFRLEHDRPLKLLHRLVVLRVILIQQAQIVVDLGARVVLFEQQPVLRERVGEVADALIVDGEAEMVRRDRDRGRRGR